MQELAMTDKYSRFVKRNILLGYTPKQKAVDDNYGAPDGTEKMLHSRASVTNLVI